MPNANRAAAKRRITLAQAHRLYPNEWIVFGEPRYDAGNATFLDGVLLFHGKGRHEAYRRASRIEGPGAIEFTGTLTHRRVTLRFDEIDEAAA